MANQTELSGITIVYLVAVGFQLFVLVFIFAKRQVMRFAWAGKKEPSITIPSDVPKELRERIAADLLVCASMKVEPKLTKHEPSPAPSSGTKPTSTWYRMKAMDDVKVLDSELECYRCAIQRKPKSSLFRFLLKLRNGNVLNELSLDQLTRLGLLYEIARHMNKPFGQSEYNEYYQLLWKVTASVRKHRANLPNISSTGADATGSEGSSDDEDEKQSRPLLVQHGSAGWARFWKRGYPS